MKDITHQLSKKPYLASQFVNQLWQQAQQKKHKMEQAEKVLRHEQEILQQRVYYSQD